MSPKLQPPKPGQTTNAPSATGPVPRKTTFGPNSIPCWTSNPADLTSPRLIQERHFMKALAVTGIAGLLAIVAMQEHSDTTTSRNGASKDGVVDASGNLRVPDDYRTTYQFLG